MVSESWGRMRKNESESEGSTRNEDIISEGSLGRQPFLAVAVIKLIFHRLRMLNDTFKVRFGQFEAKT